MTFATHSDKLCVMQNKEVININSRKLGRPTDNPKSASINIRLDEDTAEILKQYCEEKEVTRTEGVRRGIRKLSEEIGKK